MLVSLNWLGEYLDLEEYTAAELADSFSRTGLEVEGMTNYGDGLSHLVVGAVISCEPVEGSDRLSLTQVDVGQEEAIQIVCGAPNIKADMKVIVALPGAVLPGDFEIKKSQLFGHESNGMICSLQELGFSDSVIPKQYAEGIFPLPADSVVGESIIDLLDLDDAILEFDLTPNRADAYSVRGITYELAAIVDQQPDFTYLDTFPHLEGSDLSEALSINIEAEAECPIYQGRLIQGIQVKESPLWLQVRLMKMGMRPINNVVDVTNYYLLLYGQPMHAFDYDLLKNKKIQIAFAEEGTSFTTLDDTKRHLTATDLVVKDGEEVIALAGVMGGADTEVSSSTRNVLLETALFDASYVRLTSKRYGLRSESSIRFEKGINLGALDEAGEQAGRLIALLGEGKLVQPTIVAGELQVEDEKVRLRSQAIEDKLGIKLSEKELQHIMDRLGFQLEKEETVYLVTIPPRRWDIKIEADVLEEIARIYGYDRIPTTYLKGNVTPGLLSPLQQFERKTRRLAEGFGLNEVITYGLTSREKAQQMADETYRFVELDLPLSNERVILRHSLFPALMDVAQYNKARQNQSLRFYELGHVFLGDQEALLPQERQRFGVLLSGIKDVKTWNAEATYYDFYDLKGMAEAYFRSFGLESDITYEAEKNLALMHPGRTAAIYLQGERIGFLGQVHPQTAALYDLHPATFFMELETAGLLEAGKRSRLQEPLPLYPSSTRDLALVIPKEVTHFELVEKIQAAAGPYLQELTLFDLYDGEQIASDKKSMAYHLTFLREDQTITDEEISKAMLAISECLEEIPGLEIR